MDTEEKQTRQVAEAVSSSTSNTPGKTKGNNSSKSSSSSSNKAGSTPYGNTNYGRDCSSVNTSDPDKIDTALVSAVGNSKERPAILALEDKFVEFLKSNEEWMEVTGSYNRIMWIPVCEPPQVSFEEQQSSTFHRLILHRLADRFAICRTMGTELPSSVRLVKTAESHIPQLTLRQFFDKHYTPTTTPEGKGSKSNGSEKKSDKKKSDKAKNNGNSKKSKDNSSGNENGKKDNGKKDNGKKENGNKKENGKKDTAGKQPATSATPATTAPVAPVTPNKENTPIVIIEKKPVTTTTTEQPALSTPKFSYLEALKQSPPVQEKSSSSDHNDDNIEESVPLSQLERRLLVVVDKNLGKVLLDNVGPFYEQLYGKYALDNDLDDAGYDYLRLAVLDMKVVRREKLLNNESGIRQWYLLDSRTVFIDPSSLTHDTYDDYEDEEIVDDEEEETFTLELIGNGGGGGNSSKSHNNDTKSILVETVKTERDNNGKEIKEGILAKAAAAATTGKTNCKTNEVKNPEKNEKTTKNKKVNQYILSTKQKENGISTKTDTLDVNSTSAKNADHTEYIPEIIGDSEVVNKMGDASKLEKDTAESVEKNIGTQSDNAAATTTSVSVPPAETIIQTDSVGNSDSEKEKIVDTSESNDHNKMILNDQGVHKKFEVEEISKITFMEKEKDIDEHGNNKVTQENLLSVDESGMTHPATASISSHDGDISSGKSSNFSSEVQSETGSSPTKKNKFGKFGEPKYGDTDHGRDCSNVNTADPVQMDSSLIAALKTPKERVAILKVESALVDFVNSDHEWMEISGSYNKIICTPEKQPVSVSANDSKYIASFHRLILHRLADRFAIHRTHGSAMSGSVRLLKTSQTKLPDMLLSTYYEKHYEKSNDNDVVKKVITKKTAKDSADDGEGAMKDVSSKSKDPNMTLDEVNSAGQSYVETGSGRDLSQLEERLLYVLNRHKGKIGTDRVLPAYKAIFGNRAMHDDMKKLGHESLRFAVPYMKFVRREQVPNESGQKEWCLVDGRDDSLSNIKANDYLVTGSYQVTSDTGEDNSSGFFHESKFADAEVTNTNAFSKIGTSSDLEERLLYLIDLNGGRVYLNEQFPRQYNAAFKPKTFHNDLKRTGAKSLKDAVKNMKHVQRDRLQENWDGGKKWCLIRTTTGYSSPARQLYVNQVLDNSGTYENLMYGNQMNPVGTDTDHHLKTDEDSGSDGVFIVDSLSRLETLKQLSLFSFSLDISEGHKTNNFSDREVIAIECIGSPENLSMVQIATTDTAYIFDCLKLGTAAVFEFLTPVLMDGNLIKIFHDLHSSVVALERFGGLKIIQGTFDTQLAAELRTGKLLSEINEMLECFGHQRRFALNTTKKSEDNQALFLHRPLAPDTVQCAVQDVRLLISAYKDIVSVLGETGCMVVQFASDRRATRAIETGGKRQVCFDALRYYTIASFELLEETRPCDDTYQNTPLMVSDESAVLLDFLPEDIRRGLSNETEHISDIVLDIGRPPYAWVASKRKILGVHGRSINKGEIEDIVQRLGGFGTKNTIGLDGQLHRVSAVRNRDSEVIGLTMQVGRYVSGNAAIISDLLFSEPTASILFLGETGSGKTTVAREISRVLAEEQNTCIIDTNNEIAGDGDTPHYCIGFARRMMVPKSSNQSTVMLECTDNHAPEVMVVDEISSKYEVEATRVCKSRGVRVIASASGNLRTVVKNPKICGLLGLSDTVGEGQSVHDENNTSKRVCPPIFDYVIELKRGDHHTWNILTNCTAAVDRVLAGKEYSVQKRTREPTTGAIFLSIENM